MDAQDIGSSDQDRFDVFISYAHSDNDASDGSQGWVAAIRDKLVADFQSLGRPLRIFLDTDAIRSMADWRRRILVGLRQSRVLFVCISPAYFSSPYCRMEYVEYLARQAQLSGGDETIAAVYFITVPADGEDPEVGSWRQRLEIAQHVDLRQWYPLGAKALEVAEVRESIRALGITLWERIDLAHRAAQIDGNVQPASPYFVGRSEELRMLHDLLIAGREGSVTIVNGAGGMGKTELLVQYSHAYRFAFPGGVWIAGAEGQDSVLRAIATLAADPRLGVLLSDDERSDLEAAGRRVVQTLKRRGSASGPALLILDNVSDPRLFSAAQLELLDADSDLVVAASSRLGESDFSSSPRVLSYLTIDGLSPADAVALIREHQPPRAGGLPAFSSPSEEAAAAAIVRELEGYTLSVEQIAVYLGFPGSPSVADALAELQSFGSRALDSEVGAGSLFELSSRHQTRVVRRVLEQTLSALRRDDPVASAVIGFAALLPPDAIPWSWLEAWARRTQPGLFEPRPFSTDLWASVRARLIGRRIITPTDEAALGRMHRLFGDLIRESDPLSSEAVIELIRGRLHEREQGSPIAAWEYQVMRRCLERTDPDTLGWDAAVDGLVRAAAAYIGPAELIAVAETRYSTAWETRSPSGSDADAEDMIRSACAYSHVALETDLVRAAEVAESSLELARQYGASAPPTARSVELLLLSLHCVLEFPFSDAERRERAMRLSEEAVELARRLHREDGSVLDAPRLLATALTDYFRVRSGRSGWELEPLALEIVALLSGCAEAHPHRTDLRVDLASAWTRLAHSTGAQSRFAIGGEIRRRRILRACALLRAVLDDEPENHQAATALVWALVNLPVALPPAARAEAVAATDEAVVRARRLAAAFPDRLTYLNTLSYALQRSSGMHAEESLDAAHALALERLRVCLRVEETRPGEAVGLTSAISALDELRKVTKDPEESLRIAQDVLARRKAGPPSSVPSWDLREQVRAEAVVARCARDAGQRSVAETSWRNVVHGLERLAVDAVNGLSDSDELLREEAELGWEAPRELSQAYADLAGDGSWEGLSKHLRALEERSPQGLSRAARQLQIRADATVAEARGVQESESAELMAALERGTLPEVDSITCRKPRPPGAPSSLDAAVDAARAAARQHPGEDTVRRSLIRALLARAEAPERDRYDAASDRAEAVAQIGKLRRPTWGERRTIRRAAQG